MIEKLQQLQSSGLGRYSINTLVTYHEYYLKYQFHISNGASKMEAYEWSADSCGICARVVMQAVGVIEQIKLNK